MKQYRLWVSLLGVLGSVSVGCSQLRPQDHDWMFHGLGQSSTRYSPLKQINTQTVARLGLAWSLDLPGENDLEATPLEVAGVLYFSGGMAKVYAVSVGTGQLLWSYDPQTGRALTEPRRLNLPVNRGVAYADGSIYVATRDGRMISLDARTGKPRWTTQFLLPDTSSSTGAPSVCGPNVIIGNGGSESLSRGYVTAMDLQTGKVAWRFYIVPGNPAVDEDETTRMVANTWSGEWWKYGGGGNPWNSMVCDEALGQFLIGTGNAAPYALELRSHGIQDNLFIASLVAVDTHNGKYRWHYQYNPGEQWDWKATMDIALDDLEINGQMHKVALQAPSNGFFYVINRTNGKLLAAKDYGKQNWAKYIDLKTGRPVETGQARYGNEFTTIYPGVGGAHNWQAMAVDTDKKLAFIPYLQMGMSYANSRQEVEKVKNNKHAGFFPLGILNGLPAPSDDPLDNRGSLIAWNIPQQKIAWRVDYPSPWNSGTLATQGGLVFQAIEDGHLIAYDDSNGKKLWSYDAKLGTLAPPITYSYEGEQYVSLLVGYGGSGGIGVGPAREGSWRWGEQPRRLLTFRLDANSKLPATPPRTPVDTTPPITVPNLTLDAQKIAIGADLYNYSCSACHFAAAMGAGSGPDLRPSAVAADRTAFRRLLREGFLVDRGMPKFADLSDEEIEGLYQFIRDSARSGTAPPKDMHAH
jgi:quinohemoprotein ethanol dehydrogenase